MRRVRPIGVVVVGLACAACGASSSGEQVDAGADAVALPRPTAPDAGASAGDAALAGWTLTWSDEFNGPDGSAVDPTWWIHDVGGTGWGNAELEDYTDGTQNAVVEGGNLVITATTAGASAYQCSGAPCKYTSARLLTKGKFTQQYGRFEARIQIPSGQGLWPAFWLLGDDIDSVGWPKCGEIDIMENVGKEPTVVHGTLHAPGVSGMSGAYTLPGAGKLADAFHTYAIEWDSAGVRFFVDDRLYTTQLASKVTAGGTWVFDHPFFVLLNVAVGGQWPGSPDGTTTFPQTMKVDWVRVYRKGP